MLQTLRIRNYSTLLTIAENSTSSYQIWKSTTLHSLRKHFEQITFPSSATLQIPSDPNQFLAIHTDGSCLHNGSEDAIGGIGIVFEAFSQYNRSEPIELPSFRPPTNNIAELCACIRALQLVQSQSYPLILLYCDSSYVVNIMNSWLFGWKQQILTNQYRKPILNLDLILQLAFLCQDRWNSQQSRVKFIYELGHAKNTFNAAAHTLAEKAARNQQKKTK